MTDFEGLSHGGKGIMCIFVAKKKEKMKELLKRYFDLRADKVPEEVTIANIKADASFRGATLWVLVFAIFVASLGLNVNSTAVIIGAMLISPLMGPIVGMGLAVGINDLGMLKSSAKNYAVAKQPSPHS